MSLFLLKTDFFQTVSKGCCYLCCYKLNSFGWILMIIFLKDSRLKHPYQQKSSWNIGNFLEKMQKVKVKILQISNEQET